MALKQANNNNRLIIKDLLNYDTYEQKSPRFFEVNCYKQKLYFVFFKLYFDNIFFLFKFQIQVENMIYKFFIVSLDGTKSLFFFNVV